MSFRPRWVTRHRHLAETALQPWTPVFIHGDLHIEHVFVDGDEFTGIIDWPEARRGDPPFDLATLTLAHEERKMSSPATASTSTAEAGGEVHGDGGDRGGDGA